MFRFEKPDRRGVILAAFVAVAVSLGSLIGFTTAEALVRDRASASAFDAHPHALSASSIAHGAVDTSAAAVNARADEDDEAEEEDDDDAADKVPSDCSSCGLKNESDAKYCKGCGSPLSTKRAEDDDDAAPDPDEPPPSSKPGQPAPPGHHPPPPERMSANASLAAILGAKSDSIPAIKSAAIKLRQVKDAACGVTGKTTTDGIIGALLSMPERLAAGERAAAEHRAQQRKAAKVERWALANRLVACGAEGHSRGRVMVDEVGADGKRKAIGLTPVYSEMKLGTFRALVEGLEKSATRRTPFEPSEELAKNSAPQQNVATFEPSAAQLKALESHPTVYQLQRRGSALKPDQLVKGLVANYPQEASAWLKAQGVSK